MQPLASVMIVLVALATSNLSWPCECEAMQPAPEVTATADHGCCAGSQAAEEALAEVRLQQACAPGCCGGDEVALTAVVDDRRFAGLDGPTSLPAPSFAAIVGPTIEPATAFQPGARDIRGPPPPTPRRLALLQLWRC